MAGGRYLADARTASKVINELVAMNLVERSSVGGRYKLYKLTELGKAVAEELKRSQKLEELAAPAGARGCSRSLELGAAAHGSERDVEAVAAAHGVDAQPLVRRLLMEAANFAEGSRPRRGGSAAGGGGEAV